LLTFSRSAWIAFFVASLLIVGVEALKRNTDALKRVTSLAVVCLLAASPFIVRDLPYLSGRFNVGNSFAENRVENGSLIERAYLFDSANRIFVDHALTGVGLGASAVALKQAYPVFYTYYQPPHFTLLAAGFETGIFGAMFYFFLLTIPILVFVTQRSNFIHQPKVIACFALLIAIAVVGLFDYYTWLLVPGRLWQWMAWGLWSAALIRNE
jgi:O-antigen ligase